MVLKMHDKYKINLHNYKLALPLKYNFSLWWAPMYKLFLPMKEKINHLLALSCH